MASPDRTLFVSKEFQIGVPGNLLQPTVLLVSTSPLYGGAEAYHAKLAKILLSEYCVIATVCNMRLANELRALGVETVCTENSWGISSLKRYSSTFGACLRLIRRYRPRIAHLNGQSESYLAPWLRLMGLRLLTTRHTPFTRRYLQEGSRLPVFLKRWMALSSLRLADSTICVSRLLHWQLTQYLPKDQVHFLPTWVEDSFLESYHRPRPSTPLKVLFVGRVVRNKGIFDAIEAVRRCPAIQLTIVGEGAEMERAQALATGLDITFTGFRHDCKPLYRESDLLLFPSPEGFEGLPQVPLEAMAMGLPCLAGNISSILEIANASGALATYRQGDLDDLVEKLAALAAHKATLIQLGETGKLEVLRRFTQACVATPYLAHFQSVSRTGERHPGS